MMYDDYLYDVHVDGDGAEVGDHGASYDAEDAGRDDDDDDDGDDNTYCSHVTTMRCSPPRRARTATSEDRVSWASWRRKGVAVVVAIVVVVVVAVLHIISSGDSAFVVVRHCVQNVKHVPGNSRGDVTS